MRSAFVGFDSAWGGKTPGGVCCATFDGNSLAINYQSQPTSTTRKSVVEECRADAEYTLVAIDQPTMVPNRTGMRPVERVAGAVKLGVQPANLGSAMFDQSAPIWKFLDDLALAARAPRSMARCRLRARKPREASKTYSTSSVLEILANLAGHIQPLVFDEPLRG